ncbi:MAG: aminotransferase class IV [Candidatus Firestonebacteria bacterium]|nr:aminotransferase class IV [Candidatus Firestonebacteria bacterium]
MLKETPSEYVYINGEYILKENAKISVFDHGFLYGDAVFETMRSFDGKLFKLSEHIDRLLKSAHGIFLQHKFTKYEIAQAVSKTMEKNQALDAYIRICISRGVGQVSLDIDACLNPMLIIFVKPIIDIPIQGVKIAIVKTRRNLISAMNPSFKTANMLNNILSKLEAKRLNAFEGIMLNSDGYITEGSISNIFIIKNFKLITPSINTGILEGIARNTIIELASRANLTVFEELIKPEELYEIDECFLTNSVRGIIPVNQIDDIKINNGLIGHYTLKLQEIYTQYVNETIYLEEFDEVR